MQDAMQQAEDQEQTLVNAQQMIDMIVGYYAAEKYDDVEKLCLKLLAWRDDHGGAWFFRGMVAQAESRHQDALNYLAKASSAVELAIPRTIAEGKSYFALGENEKATASFQRALDFQPDNAEAHYYLAMSLKAVGDLTAARTYLRRATLLDPNLASVWYELGNVALLAERFDEALRAFEKAAKLLPDAAEVHNNLGLAQQSSANVAAAEASFLRALELAPAYAEAMANLGLLLLANGRDAEGKAKIDAALAIKPELRDVLPPL
jgi:tetratricopeptide (TPR) repeat protein